MMFVCVWLGKWVVGEEDVFEGRVMTFSSDAWQET